MLFLSFCSVAKLCLFPSVTMCTICGWGQKTNKAISLLINNIALFNLLKDVYLCGRSVILCGHFTDFAFSMAFSIALTNWALVSPVPELRASL